MRLNCTRPSLCCPIFLALALFASLGSPANGSPANGSPAKAAEVEIVSPAEGQVAWLADYAAARARAIDARKMLLVYFQDKAENPRTVQFERQTLPDVELQRLCRSYILVRLPLDAEIRVAGQSLRLLEDASFATLGGQPGLAVIDFQHRESPSYEHLVGCLPFESPVYYAPAYESKKSVTVFLSLFLSLPTGSLTQRMMIYAVRMHPERPASTSGRSDRILMTACGAHAQHQADLGLQGPHRWESRFAEIWRKTGGIAPTEVCAESWPDKNLLAACLDCVDAWHHSAGHWKAVCSPQVAFGYDIRRGKNGIWYATGIFGG